MKKSKKKKAPKQEIAVLIEGKPWKAFVLSLPPELQRLGFNALDAYEKGNARRMQQYFRQMHGIDGTQGQTALRLAIIDVLLKKQEYVQTIRELQEVIRCEEEYREGLQPPFLPTGACISADSGSEAADISADSSLFAWLPEHLTRILFMDHGQRMEEYRTSLGTAYLLDGDPEKAVQAFQSAWPFIRQSGGSYEEYLKSLYFTRRFREAYSIAGQILSLFGDPPKDRPDGVFSDRSENENDERSALSGQEGRKADGKQEWGVAEASAVIRAFFTKLLILGDLEMEDEGRESVIQDPESKGSFVSEESSEGDLQDFRPSDDPDDITDKLVSFLHKTPGDILYDSRIQECLSVCIMSMSELTDLSLFRSPFKKVLDAASDTRIYDRENDPENRYEILLPSGYQVLEGVFMEVDEGFNPLVVVLFRELVLQCQELEGLYKLEKERPGSQIHEIRQARLNLYPSKWCLCRYMLESAENTSIVSRDADSLNRKYPYLYALISQDLREILDDPAAAIDRLYPQIIEDSGNKQLTPENIREFMEKDYQELFMEVSPPGGWARETS